MAVRKWRTRLAIAAGCSGLTATGIGKPSRKGRDALKQDIAAKLDQRQNLTQASIARLLRFERRRDERSELRLNSIAARRAAPVTEKLRAAAWSERR